jgi:predicted transcriptional regulator of viral defense system
MAFKTVGPVTAKLIAKLYDARRTTFGPADAAQLLGITHQRAYLLLHRMVRNGLASRVGPGLYALVPSEMGSATEYAGNPLLIARELVGDPAYYISHGAAMEVHRLVAQPQLAVFITAARRLRSRILNGVEYRFVLSRPEHMFGTEGHWVDKTDSVTISDLERTIIDGLARPDLVGGISEVFKGAGMRRSDFDPERLVDYARRLGIGAVIRRLGFLMETCQIGADTHLERLRQHLNETYDVLDPILPREGRMLRRWRLQLNIDPEELAAVHTT